jgi:outer membrane protein OmpA-like peptidoglycan-associated protein
MPAVKKLLREFFLLTGALIVFALSPSPTRAQPAAATGNLTDQLVGMENPPDIDVAALRQQVADRIKAKAEAAAPKRPPIAPALLKLPQFRFDVVFDPDSSLVRPASYGMIGRIADALADPKLLPYAFLIVDHTESTGRRDANLALSQRRADSIREVLSGTFKISGKRLQSIGLGEEQLQDTVRPASPVNVRVQIMTVGLTPSPPPATAVTPTQKSAAKAGKQTGQKTRH